MNKNNHKNIRQVWIPSIVICLICFLRLGTPLLLPLLGDGHNEIVNHYYENTTFDTEACIALIAVAISVSIGLNIYNSIEKNELIELRSNVEEFNDSIKRSQERDIYMFLESLQVLKNESMNHQLYILFSDKLLKSTDREEIIPHIPYLHSIQRVHLLLISQYDIDPHGVNTVSPELDKLLESKGIHSTETLCKLFLTYVDANRYYMCQEYDVAIHYFKKTIWLVEQIDKMNNYNSVAITEMKKYLYNAVGISYYHCYDYDRAIMEYELLERLIIINTDQKSISKYECVYLRNFGACYERKSIKDSNSVDDLEKAIKKYEMVIDFWNPLSKEYKVFSTYCSATMRRWDIQFCKTSLEWINNVRNNDDLSNKMQDVQEKIKIVMSMNPTFSDIHIQKAKYFLYVYILSGKGLDELESEIKTSKILHGTGINHIRRDMYFAKVLMAENQAERKLEFEQFKKANKDIQTEDSDNTEAKAFAELMEQMKERFEIC